MLGVQTIAHIMTVWEPWDRKELFLAGLSSNPYVRLHFDSIICAAGQE